MREETYKGFRTDELEFQYNPRVSVPEFPQLAKVRSEQSRQVRASARSWLDVAYGASPREKLDIYAADEPGGPVLIYIHGGYWRSGSKEDNCNLAPSFTSHGATVALVEYDLCPSVTVSDIVRQTRSAIAWVWHNIERYGGDPSKVFVSGHSAGGHLTAMALAHDWEREKLPGDVIKGAAATSGVYDLEMVMRISVQQQVRMTPEIARENNPFLHPPISKCPLLIAVGGVEPEGWQRMSREYYDLCKQRGMTVEYLVVPGANHYTMSAHLTDINSPLTRVMFKLMGL